MGRSSARGNTSLESAVTLTKSLRYEIQSLGQRLAKAAEVEEDMQKRVSRSQDKARHESELKQIAQSIRKLLTRIEDAVPLISLAITASGANLSSSLPSTVSPSRLLQASTFLTAGDSQYGTLHTAAVQIGPIFTLSMYMLFQGHLRPQNEEDVRETTWKEVMHKADVRLMRVPINASDQLIDSSLPDQPFAQDVRADEYAYQIQIIEDLEDDRVHTFEDNEPQPGPFGDIPLAGIRETLPVHQISKIFYADTGKILNIGTDGETNNPVLLLKRDVNAFPPRRMTDGVDGLDAIKDTVADFTDDEQSEKALLRTSRPNREEPVPCPNPWRLPQDLDQEWMAFEVYIETDDSDDEPEPNPSTTSPLQPRISRSASAEPSLTSKLSQMHISPSYTTPSSLPTTPAPKTTRPGPPSTAAQLPAIRTSLSLLETLLRLLSLQQFQQAPHLSIPDELLTFFLSEAASTGAAANNAQERRRIREDAKRRVGFDPYDESPIKRHGEEYQYGGRDQGQDPGWDDGTPSDWDEGGSGLDEDPGNGYGGRRANGGFESPRTPSMSNRSRLGTPPSLSSGRPPPMSRWSGRLRNGDGRRSSPLSRPGTGLTDEGIGTSPESAGGGKGAC